MPVNTIENKGASIRGGRLNDAAFYSLKIWRVTIVFTPIIGWFIYCPLVNPVHFTMDNTFLFIGFTILWGFILSVPAFFIFCLVAYKTDVPSISNSKRKWVLSISGVLLISLSLFLLAPDMIIPDTSSVFEWSAAYSLVLLLAIAVLKKDNRSSYQAHKPKREFY